MKFEANGQVTNMSTRVEKTVGVVGFSSSLGQRRDGTELGPRALRVGGMIKEIEALGCTVEDHGDVSADVLISDEKEVLRNSSGVANCNKKLSDTVSKLLKMGQSVLALGGDHTMAIGSIHGHAQAEPDVGVIWVDAHADINTPLTTITGNIHGMPLSFLIKELAPYMPKSAGFDWVKPCISTKDLVYIGLRDVDPCERHIIEQFGILCFSMQEVDRYGIPAVMEMALNHLDPNGTRPLHVSFDVDAIDPKEIPSTGTPVLGGLSLRESFYIAEEVYKTGRLSVLDIAEVNPMLGNEDDQKKTVRNSIQLASRFYGSRRQGVAPINFQLPKP